MVPKEARESPDPSPSFMESRPSFASSEAVRRMFISRRSVFPCLFFGTRFSMKLELESDLTLQKIEPRMVQFCTRRIEKRIRGIVV